MNIVTSCYVFSETAEHSLCVLSIKRGSGARCFQNQWSIPGGHVDDNEQIDDACVREIYEETNLQLQTAALQLYSVEKDTETNTLYIIYYTFLPYIDVSKLSTANCEPNEISEVKLIPIADIVNYDWCCGLEDKILNCCYRCCF